MVKRIVVAGCRDFENYDIAKEVNRRLQRLSEDEKKYDVDAIILYDENSDLKALADAVSLLCANGKSVTAQKQIPEKLKYKQLLKLQERGVEILENNA